ncbi:MAG: aminoacetone oxidase family FAD-binding enzyme [Planctomycetota bacterium]
MSLDLVVVGAGAAGLWAAARAAELGRAVVVLEKTARTGTKVLASGGTRCNLTTTLRPDDAARLFGPHGERFLRRAFRQLPPAAVRERFAALGVPTVEAPLEKVFPASDRARDVRDALERWARGAGAEIRFNAEVAAVEAGDAGWTLRLADGEALSCATLFLCPGGKSYPRTGTTGDGYPWLEALDLPVVEPVPALVPLKSPAGWARALSGVALQDADVRLVDGAGRVRGRRTRPVVFTHQGVSGPGAMDLSEPVARRAADEELLLELDLVPAVERDELRAALIAGAALPGAPALPGALARVLNDAPPKRLVGAAARQAGLGDEPPRANALNRAGRHDLVEALKRLRVPVDGTLGWDKAEVTAGGLDLRAVDPGSLRVRGREGLFVFGELLDLSGPIGGLNFQAAFATAELAARAAAG